MATINHHRMSVVSHLSRIQKGHSLRCFSSRSKNSIASTKHIYHASCRTDFLHLVEQAHGLNISRVLGDLDIDSAQCLLAIDIISLIESDTKFLSSQSRDYVFENGTNNLRKTVVVTLCRFVQQMRERDNHVPGKRQRLTGR
jgi:hypothetical protein